MRKEKLKSERWRKSPISAANGGTQVFHLVNDVYLTYKSLP